MKLTLPAVLFACICLNATAQSGVWEFRFAPRIIGATVDARYVTEQPTESGVETSVTGRLSAAYVGIGYHRQSDGALYTVPSDSTDALTTYNQLDFLWELGLQQGILPRTDTTRDAAVVFALYRGRYWFPFTEDEPTLSAAGLPEENQTLRGSIVSGLAYSTVERAPVTREVSGTFAEFAVEWAPPFLHNTLLDSADYSRLTLKGSTFVPIVVLPPRDGWNRFSLYAGGFAVVDWATGSDIPQSIRGSTGGRSVRVAPGGSVRGYGSTRFDATFKAVGNLEVRASLPSVILPTIVPGVVVFTDIGYFNDFEELSPVSGENDGVLLSSGAGISIDMFDLAQLVFYTSYAWTAETRNNELWLPFAIGFGFHF